MRAADDPRQAGRGFLEDLARAQGLARERYWIDTSPPNIVNADRIHALIPDARFVYMVRDGKDTIASVLQENWGPSNIETAVAWWTQRMRAAHRALEPVPEELVATVSLESLVVDDRQEQYRRLLEFLQIPDRPRMQRYFQQQMPADRVRPGIWAQRVSDPDALDRAYRAAAEQLAADGVPIYEYSP